MTIEHVLTKVNVFIQSIHCSQFQNRLFFLWGGGHGLGGGWDGMGILEISFKNIFRCLERVYVQNIWHAILISKFLKSPKRIPL